MGSIFWTLFRVIKHCSKFKIWMSYDLCEPIQHYIIQSTCRWHWHFITLEKSLIHFVSVSPKGTEESLSAYVKVNKEKFQCGDCDEYAVSQRSCNDDQEFFLTSDERSCSGRGHKFILYLSRNTTGESRAVRYNHCYMNCHRKSFYSISCQTAQMQPFRIHKCWPSVRDGTEICLKFNLFVVRYTAYRLRHEKKNYCVSGLPQSQTPFFKNEYRKLFCIHKIDSLFIYLLFYLFKIYLSLVIITVLTTAVEIAWKT